MSARLSLPLPGHPGPILRLLAAPRTLLVLVAGSAWTVGTGWMGAMARFSVHTPSPQNESAEFGALTAAMLLFALPALMGLVTSEAAQELFRRPATNRLPGARRKVGGAALTLGLAAVLLVFTAVQLSWAPLELGFPDLEAPPCPLSTLAIGLLGLGSGSWLLVRVGHGWSWTLRFVAFFACAYGALPLLEAGTRWTSVAALVALGSAWLVSQRFRPGIVQRMAERSVPTVFSPLKNWADSGGAREAARRARSVELAPDGLGRDLAGWLRARNYEQRSAGNGLQARGQMLIFAAIPLVVACVGPFVAWVFAGAGERGSLAARWIDVLLGGADGRGSHTLMMVVGMTFFAQALVASFPLARGPFRPLSRAQLGRLAGRVAVRTGVEHTLLSAGLGLLLAVALVVASGRTWPAGVPAIALVALLNFALFPCYLVGSLAVRRGARRGRGLLGLVLLAGLGTPAVLGLHEALAPRVLPGGAPALWWSLGLLFAGACGFALLLRWLGHHYRTADLPG